MNWEEISALGQILQSFAVIISLIYLAVEIRHSTRAIRAESARAAITAMREFNRAMVENQAVSRVFRLGAEGLSNLNEDERAQFGHMLFSYYKTAEELHYQYRRGALAPELWRTWRNVLALYATSPGFKEYWSRRSTLFTPAFRAECESWQDPGLDRSDHFARGSTRSTKPPEDAGPLKPAEPAPEASPAGRA